MNLSDHSIKEQLDRTSQNSRRFRSHAAMLIVTFILCAAVIAGAAAAAMGFGMFRGIIANTPPFHAEDVIPTGYFSTVYDAEGNITDRLVGSDANRIEASYDEFPADLVNAFVAIEDSRFWQHSGIDFRAILRAAAGIITDDYSGGASTITQQLIKNTVFNGGMESSTGARLVRKIQEQYLALQLTHDMDRKDILANYLNTINLGSDTLGVKAAALRYFGKNVSDLTLSECAVLAGITKNPSYYNPITNPDNNRTRRETILAKMYRQGYITASERDAALEDNVYDRIRDQNTAVDTAKPYSYYTDELIDQVAAALKKKYDCTDTQAYNMIYSGGLNIYTPQDPKIQKIVDEEISNPENYDAARYSVSYRLSVRSAAGETTNYNENHLADYLRSNGQTGFDGLFDSKDAITSAISGFKAWILKDGDSVISETRNDLLEPQASFVLIEQSTGYVKALSGGRGEKTASRTLNRATDVLRQPGSTFKILSAFAPALDTCGDTLASVYYDSPFSADGKTFSNWWGSGYKGWHTIREAITYSMNIIALKCMNDTVTPQLGVEYCRRFGISTMTENDYYLSTALGGIYKGVSNLELTNAFAAIANGGKYTEPVFFTKITDRDGNVIIDSQSETHEAVKSTTAFLLTDAMRDAMKPNTLFETTPSVHSTGTAAAFDGMSLAGKSGTTSDNRDLWFVGYSPYYTAGIWGGCDGSQSLRTDAGDAENGGTSFHKRIWKNIMRRVHEGLPDPGFAVPEDIETAQVCRKSGKLPVAGACDYDPRGSAIYTEYFAKGTVPAEVCDTHVNLTVCRVSGQQLTPSCPQDLVYLETFLKLPEGDTSPTDDSLYAIPGDCTVHGGGSAPEDESGSFSSGGGSGGTSVYRETHTGNPAQPGNQVSPGNSSSSAVRRAENEQKSKPSGPSQTHGNTAVGPGAR